MDMKSKAPLLMMEQMVMLLVFALAAALCLQAFVKSDELSQRSQRRDEAVTAAQSAAEIVRHCQGDLDRSAALLGAERHGGDSDGLLVAYDQDWNIAQGTMRYHLGVVLEDSGVDGLGKGHVSMTEADNGETLFELDVAWQEEVTPHG